MRITKSILIGTVSCALAFPLSAADVSYGYSADEPDQFIASAYNTTNYAVIQIPAEIAAKYAGASVTGVELLCQTYVVNGEEYNKVDVFVAEDIDNFLALTSTNSEVEGNVWNRVPLDEPYVITGDKDVYVGYSMKSKRSSETLPIAVDNGVATPYGDIMGYADSKGVCYWEHAGDSGVGNVLVKAVIEGDDLPSGEVIVLSASGVDIVKPGEKFSVSGSVFNYGATDVDSYSLSCRFDSKEIASETYADGLKVGSMAAYAFDALAIDEEKEASLSVVPVIGGNDGASVGYTLDCTLAMLPRKVLVEEFSTARCGNCPSAHRALADVSGSRDDMVIVAHHSGFGEDNYTTDLDRAYLWFYQTSSWAPAFMIDRVNFADQGALAQYAMNVIPSPGPVFIVNGAADIEKFTNLAAERYAWLDVNIDYSYDPETRKLDVEVSGTPVKVLDEWTSPAVSVFLVERSDVGYQSGGGGNYTHRHIFRQTLTGNLGSPVSLKKGEPYSFKTSAVINEKLDAADLDIVAFVANSNDKDANDCKVFNVESVAIDTPSTGIGTVDAAAVEVTAGEGRIDVNGDFSEAAVYAVNGVKVAGLSAAGSVEVAAGTYLVKVTASGSVITRKIIVK